MANVKVIKRQTNNGHRYSISGLTYNQLFRIKTAVFEEAKKMKGIADGFDDCPGVQKDFDSFAQDALAVFNALVEIC